MTFFNGNHGRIYFADIGSGRPVLLLHGLGNSGLAWIRQVPFLQSAGYRVIVPDLPGHGASAPLDRAAEVKALAAQMTDLLRYLALDAADVVGVSLGGMIAMEMALTPSALVSKLAVCNTFASFASNTRREMLVQWQRQFSLDDGCVQRFEQSWIQLVSDEYATSSTGLRTFLSWHAQAAMASASSLVTLCEGMKLYDVRSSLHTLTNETLVITGALDTMSPRSEGEHIAEVIPNASHVSIEGSRHLSNVDAAKKFNWALLRFLDAGRQAEAGSDVDLRYPFT